MSETMRKILLLSAYSSSLGCGRRVLPSLVQLQSSPFAQKLTPRELDSTGAVSKLFSFEDKNGAPDGADAQSTLNPLRAVASLYLAINADAGAAFNPSGAIVQYPVGLQRVGRGSPAMDDTVPAPDKQAAQEDPLKKVNPSEPPVASYGDTSAGVRGIVSSLTGIINAVAGVLGGKNEDTVDRAARIQEQLERPIAIDDLLDGVRADYVDRMYLWTGDIDPDLYDEDCVFTDPTLSFKGLSQFQKNIANLKPILDALVKEPQVDLFSCELDAELQRVKASWRMRADIGLPWRPAIDLNGRTTFVYDPRRGNRIIDYIEEWDEEAGAVLMQLLRPKAKAE